MSLDYPRILSPPATIHWAGWETDTYRLQRAGWNLSAIENPRRGKLSLAFKHREWAVSGVTDFVEFEYYNLVDRLAPIQGNQTNMKFHVHGIGSPRRVHPPLQHYLKPDEPSIYQPIDAEPAFIYDWEPETLEDFAIFRSVNMDAKQIVLEEKDVGELINLALQKQKSSATKFRKRMLKDQEIARNSNLQAELRLLA